VRVTVSLRTSERCVSPTIRDCDDRNMQAGNATGQRCGDTNCAPMGDCVATQHSGRPPSNLTQLAVKERVQHELLDLTPMRRPRGNGSEPPAIKSRTGDPGGRVAAFWRSPASTWEK
jgi:hypothetical protein